MTDFDVRAYYDESLPPSVLGGGGSGGGSGGGTGGDATSINAQYVISDDAPAGKGEVQVEPTVLRIHTTDNDDNDLAADIADIRAQDNIEVMGQSGGYIFIAAGAPTIAGGIATVPGTRGDSGTPPTDSDAATVTVTRA